MNKKEKIKRADYDIIHNKAIDNYNTVVNPAWKLYDAGKITLEGYATIEQPAHSQYIKELEKVIGDE